MTKEVTIKYAVPISTVAAETLTHGLNTLFISMINNCIKLNMKGVLGFWGGPPLRQSHSIKNKQSTLLARDLDNSITNEDLNMMIKTETLQSDIAKQNQAVQENDDDQLDFIGISLFKKGTQKYCAYCLRRDLDMVLVLENCGHFYCPHCLLQQYHITTVTQGLGLPTPGKNGNQKMIRCYLCKQYHAINEDQIKQLKQLAKSKKIKPPVAQPPVIRGLKRCQTCFRITLKVEAIQDAQYECLNCNVLLCEQCLDIHFTNPKNENHRVLKLLEEGNYERTEDDFCPNHRERLVDYCFDDNQPLCIVCSHYEDHKNHKVRPLKDILAEQELSTKETKQRLAEAIHTIEMGFFKMNLENLQRQKLLYLEKLKGDFAVLYKMLDQKFSEIYSHITQSFENCGLESDVMKLGFQSYLSRLHYINSVNPQRDIDFLLINQLADDALGLNISPHFLHDFDIASESIFLNDPTPEIQSLLKSYDFIEISERSLKLLRNCFIDSRIVTLVTPEFQSMFKRGISSSELLFRMNRDGCTPEIFHKRCDDKGATVLLVSANGGHVFGAFNPTSWQNSYCYSECDEAFLFALQEPTGKRKPFKCPVKSTKCEFAVKQSEAGFSPGFGEANNCDLFIAFKSPNRSYCRLGNVYDPPAYLAKGLTQNQVYCLLAGKETEWEIQEIEIYSVCF